MRRILDPREPTENEVKEHQEMNHAVYRNWCPICVRASGKEMPHKRCGEKTREVPVYEFDYCFPGDELGFHWTVLAGKERGNRMFFATACPEKGGTGKFHEDKMLEFIRECGDENNNIIVKSDPEASMKMLLKGLAQARGYDREGNPRTIIDHESGEEKKIDARTMVESAPRGSKGSLGAGERLNQEIQSLCRRIFLNL